MIKIKPIPKDRAEELCKLGTGPTCCSYFAANSEGFCCLKATGLEYVILERLKKGTMNAKGDHCDGWVFRDEAREEIVEGNIDV